MGNADGKLRTPGVVRQSARPPNKELKLTKLGKLWSFAA